MPSSAPLHSGVLARACHRHISKSLVLPVHHCALSLAANRLLQSSTHHTGSTVAW